MKKNILVCTILLSLTIQPRVLFSQCTALYSYLDTANAVFFTNQSVLNNPHYYWNFGDGQTSNATNPKHIYPESGYYLVTLYALDTISQCSSVYEQWITFEFNDTTTSCVITNFLTTFNDTTIMRDFTLSTNNCFYSGAYLDGGGFLGWPAGWFPYLYDTLLYNSLFTTRIVLYHNGSIVRLRYCSFPLHFNSNENYTGCSSNMEIKVTYLPDSVLVEFEAMNKNLQFYEWHIIGFGNPIILNATSCSHKYPYLNFAPRNQYSIWIVKFRTIDSLGCERRSFQEFLIDNLGFQTGINILSDAKAHLNIYPNPVGSILNFSITQRRNISIINLFGEILLQKEINGETKLDVSFLSSGIYLIKAGNEVRKFLKE